MSPATKTKKPELLGFATPNELRKLNQKKSRALKSKLSNLSTCIKELVNEGDYLGIGGFGMDKIPTAALHEIVRQKKKNLILAGHTATHDGQILCAGNCINKIDAAYVVGVELLGLSPNYRRVFQEGKVGATEWTNATLAWRFKAAAMGVSFLPVRTMLGTETFEYSCAKEYKCPFSGETYALVPACSPDISIIHVHRCDEFGNAQIDGINVSDSDLARASKKVIITTEEIISTDEIRKEPERTIIPHYCVDKVVHTPNGCYPGNMPGKYYLDVEHLRTWAKVEKDPTELNKFIEEYIYNTKDHLEYIEKCGGKKRIQELKDIELAPKNTPSKSNKEADANLTELMICTASKYLENGKTVVVGTGLPMLAAMLAQKTHAPDLIMMFEAGGIAPLLPTLPMSVGDSRTHHKALLSTSMPEIMETCARGMVDYAFLGGAQIDKYGNLNSTLIGENHEKPKVRLPGSGGANDLASLCWNTIIIMKMDKHKFVEKLDFLTTPGFLTGKGSREKAGLPENTGPLKVITDCCILGFNKATKEIELEMLYPNVSIEDVKEKSSFEIKLATKDIPTIEIPSVKQLEILRTEIDPSGQVINK